MFRKLLLIAIIAVFFLIFVGGVVRSTGAGMGCPDWPMCFGKAVPPTKLAELPNDYLEFYTQVRIKKNLRLEKLFTLFNLEDILHDRKSTHSTYVPVAFDVQKAWIEYLNRLVGVLVGFLVLGVFIGSFAFIKKKQHWVVLWSFFALIILLIEAFLGSIVVSTNLFPELISVHMLLALLLVFMLMFLYFKLYQSEFNKLNYPKPILWLAIVVLLFSVIQLLLGIGVREEVDYLKNELSMNKNFIGTLPPIFKIHRSFSILVLLLNFYMFFQISRFGLNNNGFKWVMPLLFVEVFAGLCLANFDLPNFVQPFHLIFASLLIGMQFLNFLYLKFVVLK
jgi:heme a synthase